MVNQVSGPIISETITKQQLDPLENLDRAPLELNGGGMYPQFVAPKGKEENNDSENSQDLELNKSIDNTNENISENVLEKYYDNPVTPILKRINKIRGVHIGDKDLQKIYNKLGDINHEDDVISKLIDSIDSAGLEKKVYNIIVEILSQVGKNNDERLKKDSDIDGIREEFKGNTLLENDKYKDIVNLLSKNYISFPDGDSGKGNFEKDLQLSIETTVNKMIHNKQIPKTQGFEDALINIKSGSLETQLDALKYIYILTNTNEGKEGKASKLLHKNIKNGETLEKKSLQDRFDDLQERLKIIIEQNNIVELKKIEVEVNNMKKEADKEGDIFIVSDLDKISGEIDSVLKETT